MTYDVIVVGAGPCGLLAARAAAAAGCSVVLLERKSDLTQLDRMCGQTLVSLNDYYFNNIVRYDPEKSALSFVPAGLMFSYTGPVKNLYGWHIYSPDGNRLCFGSPDQPETASGSAAVGLAFDKEVLFRCLLNEVLDAGAEVFPGIAVEEVDFGSGDYVQARGSGMTVKGRYLIAADGTDSPVAAQLGFNKSRLFYSYLLCAGAVMRNVRVPRKDVLISGICFTEEAPAFMFIFPRPYEEEMNVAFLTLDPRVNLQRVKHYFISENDFFAPWFERAQEIRTAGSSQKIYSPVNTPFVNRVLLAGDAASCQELENSGAMLSGWKAGCCAAAACRETKAGISHRAFKDYLKWWRSVYIDAYSHEHYLMNFAFPYVLSGEDDLNYLCRIAEEPLPPCWNPYAATAYLGDMMGRLMPVIQRDRPDMAQRLSAMSGPVSEILAGTTKHCLERENKN